MSIIIKGVDKPKTCWECAKMYDIVCDGRNCPIEECDDSLEAEIRKAYNKGYKDGTNQMIEELLGIISDKRDEPQTDIHDLTDCDFCKDRNCKDCEGGKGEPQTDWTEAVEQREHDILYEPTYDVDDGSM